MLQSQLEAHKHGKWIIKNKNSLSLASLLPLRSTLRLTLGPRLLQQSCFQFGQFVVNLIILWPTTMVYVPFNEHRLWAVLSPLVYLLGLSAASTTYSHSGLTSVPGSYAIWCLLIFYIEGFPPPFILPWKGFSLPFERNRIIILFVYITL